MRGFEALCEAIRTVPVPGAPARFSLDGAALGLSFLDTSLRLNHVRRLTERLTVSEHRAARRTIEIDVSLRLLDEGQRQAAALFQTVTSHHQRTIPELVTQPVAPDLWVPVARISRQSVSPVDVLDANGQKLPRLTQYETSRLLASGLYRLLRGVLSSHRDARQKTTLNRVLQQQHEPRWLIQHALLTLLTDRSQPNQEYTRRRTPAMIDGQGAEIRNLALEILDENGKYGKHLDDYYRLLDIAINEYLLVVALDATSDEQLLTYDSPVHFKDPPNAPNWLRKMFRANNRGYQILYEGEVPASLSSYHLVFDVEDGISIEQMYLTTDADRAIAAEITTDLETLAGKLRAHNGAPRGRSTEKILELETQTTLRHLSELVRRRRWDADHAGFCLDESHMPAVSDLCWAATSGEATAHGTGPANNSILAHALVRPRTLEGAAGELDRLDLSEDLSLENDPTTSRAHAYWRRRNVRNTEGAQIRIRAGLILRDTTAAGPRSVFWYALSVAVIAHSVIWFLTGQSWPYTLTGAAALHDIGDRDAIIAVLLLVPGFLYTRLTLPDRQSITGYLRAVPRMAAHSCIGSMAILAAGVATGVAHTALMVMFAVTLVLSVSSAITIITPDWSAWLEKRLNKQTSTEERLRSIGAPQWVGLREPADHRPTTPDVIFSSWRS